MNNITLSSVQAQFTQWRTERQSGREPTPNSLKQQALALCEHYSNAQVVNALTLSHTALKRWKQENIALTSSRFVTLEADALATPSPAKVNRVTVCNTQGVQLEIQGLSTEQLCALVATLGNSSQVAL